MLSLQYDIDVISASRRAYKVGLSNESNTFLEVDGAGKKSTKFLVVFCSTLHSSRIFSISSRSASVILSW